MKISVILGTRPEAIKLAPVILALRSDPRFRTGVCVTAQHRRLLDQILDVFDIVPDADLDLMRPGQSLPDLTCSALIGVSEYLQVEKPGLVLVQGDTTNVLATSLAAFYQGIPVGHVEAGLRTGNLKSPWPEEANRVLTGHLATLHFVPTEVSRKNLLREGIPPRHIFLTGNTVIDALHLALERARRNPPVIPQLEPSLMSQRRDVPLVLITAHRRENFGGNLECICQTIARLATCFPHVQFVYPVHPNPNVRTTVARTLGSNKDHSNGSNVHLIEPLSYLPFVALMERATLILTDSGGIQEEAPSLGKPVLVMRDTTERPEGLQGGTVRLVGTDPNKIFEETARLLSDARHYRSMARVQNPFGDGAASRRIIAAIGTYLQGAARGESDPCDSRRRTDSAPTSPSVCALRNSLRQLPTPILPDKNA
jgi:UDP-N-acetylglucosamine 2-epimerase (non-hydrolysing)